MQSGILKYAINTQHEFSSYLNDPSDNYLVWYYHDIVGNQAREKGCILALTLAVKKYLNLAPDTPIKLVSNDKDLICDQAFAGEHCLEKPGHVTIEREAGALTLLEQTMQTYQIAGPFERVGTLSDLATFHVLTTIGTLKNILRADKNLGVRIKQAC